MKIPRPKPRIDVDAVREAAARGLTIPQFAAEHGYTSHAVRAALRRAGIALPRAPRIVRDRADRVLRSMWNSIRARCTRPESQQYPRYGGMGVRLCAAWNDFMTFRNWARASGYEPGRLLMLRVRSQGYRPANCYWATRGEVIRAGQRYGAASGPSADADRRRLDEGAIERLYVRKGLSITETAARLNATYSGILGALTRNGWYRGRPTPAHALKHGSTLKKVWDNMRERCTSRRHSDFKLVGGRGIRVDRAWREFSAFHEWALRSGYRRGLVIHRLNPDGNFSPDNCAWMTRAAIMEVRRPPSISRKPHWTVTAFGETKGPLEWSRDPRCKVSMSGLVARLRAGRDPEEAITAESRSPGSEFEGRAVTAFGMTQSISAWSRDRRARVGTSSIRERIEGGMPPEQAITKPPFAAQRERVARQRRG